MPLFYPNMASKPNARSAGPAVVTLLSDFGLADAYVAAMKAAILRTCPWARLIDVTHLIPPGDILAGSFALERAVAAFEPGSVHLAVVDPGVGTSRRILVCEIAGRWVVCPDNGLITWAWRRMRPVRARALRVFPKIASPTFHGRDIMGPMAGAIAAGESLAAVTRPIKNPVLLNVAPARRPAKSGQIIHIDRFGNATTNIPADALPHRSPAVIVDGKKLGKLRRTYGDVRSGVPLALVGSANLLEIAVRNGSAAVELGLRIGMTVNIA
jgi:hypothetical protein